MEEVKWQVRSKLAFLKLNRLGGRPPPALAAQHELLPCGITVITDAATLAADPDSLKKVRLIPHGR